MKHWLNAPALLPAIGGCVHVWTVALDNAQFDMRSWQGQLSPEERSRAERFKLGRDRRRYVVAHVALRNILAAYTKTNAAALRFMDRNNGKPILAEPFANSGIEFNLSHSHEKALVSVTQGRVVGVDLEFVKSDFVFAEVAERFFTKQEVAALHALPLPLRRHAFYRCWTSKEAFLKAKGTGLSGALDEVEISSTSNHVVVNAFVPGWSLTQLNPGDGYEGALVVEGEAVPIYCYRWQVVSTESRR